MSPAKTVYVPRFGSQLGSSQREEPQPDPTVVQPESQSQQVDKCRKKRDGGRKPRSILKVKLPTFSTRGLPKKKPTQEDQTPGRWTPEPAENRTSVTARGSQDADSVRGDVFFSQRSTYRATNEKKKATLAVLRTISRMLEENHLIRQRLVALTQAHLCCTT
ncbi:uncharacterized protein [Paralichthys olivaceus]|uniref:uncharacterized protein n=1 Tax=Paralichthys olivaceus TaxID=8255 RepID=UPI00375303CB